MPQMPNPVLTIASRSATALRLFVVSLLFGVFLLPIQARSEPASRPTKANQVEWITKSEVRSKILEEISSSSEYKYGSEKKETLECIINETMDDIFGNKTQLTSQDLSSRLSTLMEKKKNGDSRLDIIRIKCNSAQSESVSRPAKADQAKWITKLEVKQSLREGLLSDQKYKSDPLEKEAFECFFDQLVDDVFGNKKQLTTQDFEKKFKLLMDSIDGDDPRTKWIVLRCFANSKEVEKRLSQNAQEQRSRSNAASTPLLNLDDFRLDASELDGKRVRVRGVGQYVMDTFTLRKSATDMSPVFIELKNLPREQRKEIINRCGDIMEGCRLTVYGMVKAQYGMKTIVAEQIIW